MRGILERESRKQGDDEADIGSQNVEDEFLDIVKDATAFFDCAEDGGKVIVGEDNVGAVPGDIRAGAHGDADICSSETGAVVDSVARHGDVATSSVESIDHAYLCAGCAAGDDEGQLW